MLIAPEPFTDRRGEYAAASPAPGAPPRPGMVWIPGGTFAMGCAHFYPEERPVRRVAVSGFWMDATPVTNAAFAKFVAATGYVTLAERAEDDPASAVFVRPRAATPLDDPRAWWKLMKAGWRHPRGRKSTIAGMAKHPVVQVTYEDALAYCAWAGTSLPTEAEWEFAARGGLDGAIFAWGNRELGADGKRLANTWQGRFPDQNLLHDGYEFTSPAGAYPANGYGLYDMAGNVWELTAQEPAEKGSCCGPATDAPQQIVIKGGSYLCAPNYCFRYRPAAKSSQARDFATSHIGFRCIVRPTG